MHISVFLIRKSSIILDTNRKQIFITRTQGTINCYQKKNDGNLLDPYWCTKSDIEKEITPWTSILTRNKKMSRFNKHSQFFFRSKKFTPKGNLVEIYFISMAYNRTRGVKNLTAKYLFKFHFLISHRLEDTKSKFITPI